MNKYRCGLFGGLFGYICKPQIPNISVTYYIEHPLSLLQMDRNFFIQHKNKSNPSPNFIRGLFVMKTELLLETHLFQTETEFQ